MYITTFILALFFCIFGGDNMVVYGADNAERIAAVTCAVIKETKNMDSAIRVEKMNAAREKLDLPPFLDGDDEIIRSVKWGTCELLVLNSPDYETTTQKKISAYNEKERIKKEKIAEADKIAAKKKAEDERKAQEKLNMVLNDWEAAARKEISNWKIFKEKLSIYPDKPNVFFTYSFPESGNLDSGMELYGDVIVKFNDKTLPTLRNSKSFLRKTISVPYCLPESNDCTAQINLDTPKLTREIKQKFFSIFGSGKFGRAYPPIDSYEAKFIVKGISWYQEPYDFNMEYYPELKEKSTYVKKCEFINPIVIILE